MNSELSLEEKEILSDLLNKKESSVSEKKPLRSVLSKFLDGKQIDEDVSKKLKEKFSDIKLDMNEAKTSYDALMEIQKKLSKAYKDLKNEKK